MQSGLPEEIKKLIGKTSFYDISPILVQKGLWQNFCSAIEDSNPIYWDESKSKNYRDGPISHPALLPSWVHDFEWHPDREKIQPMQLHFHIKDLLELPLGIVTEVEIEFYEPVIDGDEISSEQKLISISDIVKTKLGKGRYWLIEVKYHNQKNQLTGKQNIRFLGYKK
jgi:acyl dehydratase